MPRIYMIRHGEAASAWHEAADPGLSDIGRDQALAVADKLQPLGPLPIFSSPLARARETALPLAGQWQCDPVISDAVTEVPAPADRQQDRRVWLTELAGSNWADVGPGINAWRNGVLDFLLARDSDCTVFSHFVAINAALGASIGDERVFCFRPANASVTVFDTDGARLTLVAKGAELVSVVN